MNQYIIIDDRVEQVKTVVVHEFALSNVEDPDLYAAEPLYQWQHSEQGQWVIKNVCEAPVFHKMLDHAAFGYNYRITAKLVGTALTEWLLKYDNQR